MQTPEIDFKSASSLLSVGLLGHVGKFLWSKAVQQCLKICKDGEKNSPARHALHLDKPTSERQNYSAACTNS